MNTDGPLAKPSRLASGRVPVPSGHAPRLEAVVDDGALGLRVQERALSADRGAWMHAENPVEVRR